MPLPEAMAMVKSRAGIQFDPHIVDILEQRYVELEKLASKQSGTIEPLITDIAVWRPATGMWWILTSASGFTGYTSSGWGTAGDKPLGGIMP